jgi:hypothetical protein
MNKLLLYYKYNEYFADFLIYIKKSNGYLFKERNLKGYKK